ncbi:MAG: hypothetical protein KGI08_09705 [Thaumarchaeota archaeon]|nr:hypothetical protein [Nitrososphaerota archaeon]
MHTDENTYDQDTSLVHSRVQGQRLKAAQLALSTQVKVDEHRLKRTGVDLLPEILSRMEKQRTRLLADENI